MLGAGLGRIWAIAGVNVNVGRDHWPGSEFRPVRGWRPADGQVVGSTEKHGERPKTRPLGAEDVMATVYQRQGSTSSRTFSDHTCRPLPLLDNGKPIAELV